MKIHVARRGLHAEEVNATQLLVQHYFDFGKSLIPGEVEKTSEQLELVGRVNYAFRKEFVDLGIGSYFEPIDPGSVHFLNEEVYHRVAHPTVFGVAYQQEEVRAIIVNTNSEEYDNRAEVFTILHEAAHLLSYKEFYAHKFEGRFVPSVQRSGYRFRMPNAGSDIRFTVLDEAVCDLVAREVQTKNFELFFGQGATMESINPMVSTYSETYEIIEMLEKITRSNGENLLASWRRFYRSLFTGDMSVLADIETTLGKGSLRELATQEIYKNKE